MRALDLIRRIQSGEDARGAEADLYRLVQEALLPRIRARMSARLGVRMDPEDILHDAFLKTLESLDTFRASSEKSFLAWVYSIARNLSVDEVKRRSAALIHFARGEDEKGPRESRLLSREENEDPRQVGELIEAILKRLPEKEAQVIRLRELDGFSFEDIAGSWGKTPGAVQRFHSRAMKRFRALANLRPS